MAEKGLEPDFSRDALSELAALKGPAPVASSAPSPGIRDLRESALMKVKQGTLCLAEINRVTKD